MEPAGRLMASASPPLVVHVAFGLLGDVVDPAEVARIAPGAEVRVAHYDLGHDQRTRRSHEPHATDLHEGEPDLDDDLRSALADAEVMLALDAPLDLPVLAPRLRWIQAIGSGVSHFLPSGLAEGGVRLTNAAGVGAVPIAEWVLARVLATYKRLDEHADQQRRHHWEQALGSVLAGQRALVVGLGSIGTAVARRLRAFDVHVTGVRRSWQPGATSPDADELIGPDALLDALGSVDVVVLCAPSSAATEDLFDEAAFAAMRPGSTFVNVARGSLVDEVALVAALERGHLRGAAIDVAKQEPLPSDSPLWDAPGLAISPHSSTSADRYLERSVELFYDNLRRYVADEPLRNEVDLADLD